ncbi:ribose-5-phosphate isomerase RpiA [Legionella sp. W05-934-2]|jgi:ribose 5-phosphate isomerase A|uniref:ribose-5-phosphate isomerase RpiA n=1 Tax=Legionella sp. W05-934-2 TaxID=1198649 RepID=UPI00346276AC
MDQKKQKAAEHALSLIKDDMVVGVGTGSTVNYFIDALASIKHRIDSCVASSVATEERLRQHGINVIDLNVATSVPIYIDGADEVNSFRELVKGGGGALTREKIIATVAKEFVVVVDDSKVVKRLGEFPVAVEVIPMARSYVARQIVKLGGNPEYREGFVTDNGNIILDVFNLTITNPMEMERNIKAITGVVDNGLFAQRVADKVIVASDNGISEVTA